MAATIVALLLLPALLSATSSLQQPQKPEKAQPAQAPKKATVTPTIPTADRNQQNKVFLEYADILQFEQQPMAGQEEQFQVVKGNVKLRKGGMFMYCDSAYVYEAINSFEAFGNVRMEQGDTLFVTGDYLDYDGLTEEAILYADAGKKVRLRNRDVTLTTDIFHYDMYNEIGFYDVGGELTDKQNRLTSWVGEYYPQTKDAFFSGDVHLTSRRKNDELRINTDSLEYNTDTHIAHIVSPSEVINSDGIIYTTDGFYNTDSGEADLYRRSTVKTNRGNTLTGDTLFYDRQKQYGEAFGNMVITDSARQSSLQGDYGFYDDVRDSAFVTGRALAKEYSQGDTLYLHGDSITAYLDLSDSTKVTNVFHRVRFYRIDLQGLCDSLSLTERDSLMRLYRAPVVWSGRRQIFGNQINVHLNDSTVDWARLPLTGMMAEHIAEDCYNQLSGNDMTAWFNDSTVRRLYVEGNVMVNIFPMESDSSYNKFAYVESSYMDAYFSDNKVESIHFWPETTSKITPLYLAKRNSYFLPKFRWYEDLRPVSPEDVFVVSDAMLELINSAPPLQESPDGPGGYGQGTKKTDIPNPSAPADRMMEASALPETPAERPAGTATTDEKPEATVEPTKAPTEKPSEEPSH